MECPVARTHADRSHIRREYGRRRSLLLTLTRSLRADWLLVAGGDFGFDAAAYRKIADDGHPSGLTRRDKVVQDLLCDIFVENTLIAEINEIVLECLQFDTQPIGDVSNANLTEIRQSGFWTHRRELRASNGDLVVTVGLRIGKRFDRRA